MDQLLGRKNNPLVLEEIVKVFRQIIRGFGQTVRAFGQNVRALEKPLAIH